ncbi:glycosyltransferase [Loktanella sp. DJP18]|uniref:glycosyltransferase n=1 Tax=Loktanella sp. DJP18 TaxID=3409788 RepID=UPI003BB6A5C4
MPNSDICFLATSKSGLGHLRRSATIARRLRTLDPARKLHLISNAPPQGLTGADLDAFASIQVADRAAMSAAVAATGAAVMVVDTMTVPDLELLGHPMALVLRETPNAQLPRFALTEGRPWDLIVVANPVDHWMPDPTLLNAQSRVASGWIYRSTGQRRGIGGPVPRVLVATGGGGPAATARTVYAQIDVLLARLRRAVPAFDVTQAIGARARGFGQLAEADDIVDPGAVLNDLFREADIVISTAGYNSVLELAMTDTPTLLVPIPRSIDDQTARARTWAQKLGMWLDAAAPARAADWLAQEITLRRRRPPVDLGPSGEDKAARAILALG